MSRNSGKNSTPKHCFNFLKQRFVRLKQSFLCLLVNFDRSSSDSVIVNFMLLIEA